MVYGKPKEAITTSLLVISPGQDIYSVFGHTAIRMQYPKAGLDYCFTFETEAGAAGYLAFFAGQSKAGFLPVPTQQFLEPYQAEGRGIRQYDFNLTHKEKQELWRALDNDMMEGAHRKFNLLQNNCTSMAMTKVESVMMNEELDFGHMPEQMYYNNGNGIKWLSRRSPWGQFLFMTFVGAEADKDWSLEQKLSPELIIPVLTHTVIRSTLDSSAVRPMLVGNGKTILPQRTEYKASPITPNIVFGALLLLTIVAFFFRSTKVARAWLTLLFVAQTIVGCFLVYVTLVAGLFGIHCNWLLIAFNPLPVIIWLCCRKKAWYGKVYLAYAAILALFLLTMPWLTSQLLPAHYLLVATLMVACLTKIKCK